MTETTDKLDHAFTLVKTKQGYRVQSKCSYPDTKRPQKLKEDIINNFNKLESLDYVIRGHYFNDLCNHKIRLECESFILKQVMKITGYEPRQTTKVTEGSP